MWELDHKESWAPKNWCFWTVVLEKTLESLMDSREIKPVNPKGNQSWVFTGRTDGEAEVLVLWPPDGKNWLTGKDPDARRLKAGGEGDDRGWDDWMASPTQWNWVWASSRSWWWTGKSHLLLSIGSQRVRQDWATALTEEVSNLAVGESKRRREAVLGRGPVGLHTCGLYSAPRKIQNRGCRIHYDMHVYFPSLLRVQEARSTWCPGLGFQDHSFSSRGTRLPGETAHSRPRQGAPTMGLGALVASEWEGNRQEGQGSPNRGNSLQVSDIFISLKRQEETN